MVRDASPSSAVVAPDLMPFLPFAVMFSVPVPLAATIFTSLDLLQAMRAVSSLVSVKPSSTSVTPVVPF